MTQYLLEEACSLALDLHEARIEREAREARERAHAVAAAQAQVRAELAAMERR